ncbi:preprotein translocase subunit Sec61beta [Sulfolobales archaeon HS-7]|nr:preprotein translocase subunit Sec61beta [Sulfolobales archaeon HS-7]
MPSKKKKENIPVASMAGLIRYYEEEKEVIKVSPTVVIVASIAVVVVVAILSKILPI